MSGQSDYRNNEEKSPYPILDDLRLDAAFKQNYRHPNFSEKPLIRPMNPRRTNGHRGVMIYPRNS